MEPRQPTAATPTPTAGHTGCPVYNLPANGVLYIPGGSAVTLSAGASFKPLCTGAAQPAILTNGAGTVALDVNATSPTSSAEEDAVTSPQLSDFRDPFYASTFPQCYALAATTVIAYTLVIMLFITPRSFLDGGVVVLGRRGGFTSGGTSGVNIGGRPWLQKVAALLVAVSLTVATTDTFHVAEEQYMGGYSNAKSMQADVLGSTQLKVIRLTSEAFLWLAQAQTLIRLFPRQREKVVIKWTAFALIGLGVIFDSLNSFTYTSQGAIRPRSFTDAIPALSYLFQLSLGVLYAAWVIYYALMKKRFAFYHPQMRNMCLVALLSMLAVMVPVVFFVLDISKPDLTVWGDYVRWVGAAAASVIVWEWVERIEALEREEKKDGVLGREIFDGDEMLEMTASEFTWPRRRRNKNKNKGDDEDGGEGGAASTTRSASPGRGHMWPAVSGMAARHRSRSRMRGARPGDAGAAADADRADRPTIRFLQPPLWPARPPPAATPVSRTDTTSADSTVYAVRYHPVTETTSQSTPPPPPSRGRRSRSSSSSASRQSNDDTDADAGADRPPAATPEPSTTASYAPSSSPAAGAAPAANSNGGWRPVLQANQLLFRREPARPAAAAPRRPSRGSDGGAAGGGTAGGAGRWDLRGRLEDFAASQAERLRERIRPTPDTDSLPVTVIPAPPRRGAALARLLEEEAAAATAAAAAAAAASPRGSESSSLPVGTSAQTPPPPTQAPWRRGSGAEAAAARPHPYLPAGRGGALPGRGAAGSEGSGA